MYEVGDRVDYKLAIFIMDAEVLEVYDDLIDDYKYYIRYVDYNNQEHECLAKEKDLIGYTKGTKKHLKQELDKLINEYSVEEILEIIKTNEG